MRFQTIAYFSLILFKSIDSNDFNYPLIKDYLQWHNIKAILFVKCDLPNWIELDDIRNNLKINDIYLNYWDTSSGVDVADFNYQHFFTRLTYPMCVIVEWECNATYSILNIISNRTLFHYERHWLIFGRNSEEMFTILSEQYINVDAEVAVVEAVTENEYELRDVYNPSVKRGGSFRMGIIGSWSNITGLVMDETTTKFQRRHNFNELTFFAAITIPKLPPNKTFIEHIDSDDHRYLYMDNMSKSNYRVFQVLSEKFNFKMTMRRARIWGRLMPDSSWMGVVGLLNRSETDIAISGLRWESDRYGVFDQTTNSFYVQIVFVFRHPKSVDAWNVFLSPFVWIVWLLIGTIGIATSVLIRFFFFIENRLSSQSKCIATTSNDDTYYNSFLIIIGILFQQGCSDNPSFYSTRIFTLTYLMFSVVIYQFYGSYIVGSLLTESPKTIKTMKHLLNAKLDFAMDELPYIQDTFCHVIEETAVEMYNRIMSQPKPFMPLFTGLELVKKGTMAFNTDAIFAYAILKTLLTDDEYCDLQQISYAKRIPTGPGLPKRSPLREFIKIGVRRLHETGIISHIWKTWISQKTKCARSEVDVVPVDMIHFSSALYVMGFGLQLSLLIFCGERFAIYFLKLSSTLQSRKPSSKIMCGE